MTIIDSQSDDSQLPPRCPFDDYYKDIVQCDICNTLIHNKECIVFVHKFSFQDQILTKMFICCSEKCISACKITKCTYCGVKCQGNKCYSTVVAFEDDSCYRVALIGCSDECIANIDSLVEHYIDEDNKEELLRRTTAFQLY